MKNKKISGFKMRGYTYPGKSPLQADYYENMRKTGPFQPRLKGFGWSKPFLYGSFGTTKELLDFSGRKKEYERKKEIADTMHSRRRTTWSSLKK